MKLIKLQMSICYKFKLSLSMMNINFFSTGTQTFIGPQNAPGKQESKISFVGIIILLIVELVETHFLKKMVNDPSEKIGL